MVFVFYSDKINKIINDKLTLGFVQIVLFILFIYISAIIIQILKNRLSALSFFITSIIPLSLIYLMLFCPWHTPDATPHIAATYRFSNIILGQDDWQAPSHDAKYFSDVYIPHNSTYPLKKHYHTIVENYDNLFINSENKNSDNVKFPIIERRMEFYSIFNYIPFVSGFVIGRLMDLSTQNYIYLSRILMILTYILFGCYAIKKMPFYKNVVSFILLIPLSIMYSSAFSYEGIIYVISLNFIASILQTSQNYTLRNKIECCLFSFLIGAIKGGGYCLLTLWSFAVNKKNPNRNIFILSVIASCAFSMILFNNIITCNTSFFQFGYNSENLKASYALTNTLEYISMLQLTYINKGWWYIKTMVGYLSHLEQAFPTIIICMFYFVIILSSLLEGKQLDKRNKILSFVIFILFSITMPAMLLCDTYKWSAFIIGIQGRYYLPVFILLLFSIGSISTSIKKYKIEYILYSFYSILSIIVVLNMLILYLGR